MNEPKNKNEECLAANGLEQLIKRALERSGLSYETFVGCITQNAFRSLNVWNESDLERYLLTCEELGLSPTSKSVYALQPEDKRSGVLLCIGLDGWVQLINQHPAYDGMTFTESAELEEGIPKWIECKIYRNDRRVPLSVREYFIEVRRDSSAWITHPRRMLRHKAIVQCARLAFSLPNLQSMVDHDDLLIMQNLKRTAKDKFSSQEVKHPPSSCQETQTEHCHNSGPLPASEYQGTGDSRSFSCEDSNTVFLGQKSRKESSASWVTAGAPSSSQALIERLEAGLSHLKD